MKFTVEHAALVPCVDIACPVVIKSGIPILNDALLATRDGQLSICGTDMEIRVTADCHANIAEEGAVCVNAAALQHFINSLPEGCQINGAIESGMMMVLRAGRSRCCLATLPAADFPEFLFPENAAIILQFSASDLAHAIDRVAYAISREQTRYYLCGIYLVPERNSLSFVATNGNVLARSSLPIPNGAHDLPAIIMPSATINVLRSLLRRGGDVELCWSEDKAGIKVGAVSIVSKLINGTFPNYSRVVPERIDSPVIAERGPLSVILKRTAGIVERSKDGRAVRFDVEADGIEITGRGEHGEIADHINAKGGTPFSLTMNALAVRDTLEAMDGDMVEMHSHGPGAPVLFVSERADDLFVVTSFRG